MLLSHLVFSFAFILLHHREDLILSYYTELYYSDRRIECRRLENGSDITPAYMKENV